MEPPDTPVFLPDTQALPEFRLQCNHSFENVGVNFYGPLYGKGRDKNFKSHG